MNRFLYKRFVFTRRTIPLWRDLTKVRRLTWVGWFFLYKPLLKIYFWWYKNKQVAENYFSVKFYIAFCLMINTIKSFEQLCCEEKVLNVEYDIQQIPHDNSCKRFSLLCFLLLSKHLRKAATIFGGKYLKPQRHLSTFFNKIFQKRHDKFMFYLNIF